MEAVNLVGKSAEPGGKGPDEFAGAPTFPMSVNRFLAGDYMKRADIVLSRHTGSPFSWAIRWSTKSIFSHAALVFHTRDHNDGFNNTFIIEAGTSGVDLTNLRDYAVDPHYVIGIKRFDRDWFGDDVQRFVRGHLLDHIKDEYDYWRVVTMVRALIRSTIYRELRPFRASDKAESGRRRWTPGFARVRRGANANEFICSGLVQYGYFNAIYKLVKANLKNGAAGQEARMALSADPLRTRHLLKPDLLKECLFSDGLVHSLDLDETGRFKSFRDMRRFWNRLHATTPRDLEETESLKWLYVIRDGMVHDVASLEDVQKIVALPRRYTEDPTEV
ncbi:MAG: hypothetical protein R3D33_16630 [Hyphomicrobiaceae bacterium]